MLIKNKEDWTKVRKLARKWYKQMDWWLPTKLLQTLSILFLVIFIFNSFDLKWLTFSLVIWGYLYGREQKVEGYVDGWDQGQEFAQDDTTIDELLEYDKDKPSKKDD